MVQYSRTHTPRRTNAPEKIQRCAARFMSGDYKSRSPGSINKLLNKFNLPTLEERRKQLRLIMFYKVVEGLVPAMPPNKFLTPQKPGRLIRSRISSDFISNNVIDNYIRNNDRCYSPIHCKTDQYKFSYFPRTIIDWNHLNSDIVNSKTLTTFRSSLDERLTTKPQ